MKACVELPLSEERTDALVDEFAGEIALDIVSGTKTPVLTFVSIREQLAHDLRESLENLRLPEGGEGE